MGYVVKLGGERPGPTSAPGAKPPTPPARKQGETGTGLALNSRPVAIGAGVVLLLAVCFGLWIAFGGGGAPAATGPISDKQGIYAPPELAGRGSTPAAGLAPGVSGPSFAPGTAGASATPGTAPASGVYAPPEVTGR